MLKKLASLFLATVLAAGATEVARIAPTEAAKLVANGKAVLVDVREASEWLETGVASPAVLLPKSDFENEQFEWKPFLARTPKSTTVILYCRSGKRAGIVGAALAEKGYTVVNAGGFKEWAEAGLPTRKITQR
jgi:phage shock protein E